MSKTNSTQFSVIYKTTLFYYGHHHKAAIQNSVYIVYFKFTPNEQPRGNFGEEKTP